MRYYRHIIFVLIGICICDIVHAQELHKICPISLKSVKPSDTGSFVLTTSDYNAFQGKKIRYAPAMEIIDADEPWPPRWFALHPSDTASDLSTSRSIILNAGVQGDKFLFFTVITLGGHMNNLAILMCNRDFQMTDTFCRRGKEIDSHDFRLTGNGDMMYFPVHDTIMDIRKLYKNNVDSAVRLIYETIAIDDSKGKNIFSWNPLVALGIDAVCLPYRYAQGVMAGKNVFDWSHANSIDYDYDGNILYSLKHIGIGKISRADGHLIWHIDRNKQKINAASDAVPIFLQHDFHAVKDEQGNISYTILSNGDDEHPECNAYQFTVNFDKEGLPVVKLIKKMSPVDKVSNSGGGANLDEEANGNYLMNYGLFKQDTTLKQRPLFEYDDVKSSRREEYTIEPDVFAYRVHRLHDWRPVRPVITEKGGKLIADSKTSAIKWYHLSGTDLHIVEYVGNGEKHAAKEDGYYCVSVKYGIGWSVSRPFKFSKTK